MTQLSTFQSRKWLYGYSFFLSIVTFLLIIAGGLVTSHEAGLAVPDWPLSYGQMMPPMVGNIFWEHGHRMIAGAVGILTFIFAVLIQNFETRAWMKRLGWIAFAAVVFQALLGGLTVLWMLPAPISIFHACLAQSFFSLIVTMVYFLKPKNEACSFGDRPQEDQPRLYIKTSILIFVQLVLGATIRHTGQGVFFHVGMAFVVIYHILLVSNRLYEEGVKGGAVLGFLAFTQLFLGVGAFLFTQHIQRGYAPTNWEVFFASAHQSLGALILALSVLITVMKARNDD